MESELLELEGEPGRFKARIRKKPRYIDLDKCTSCGECTKVCPVDLPDAYQEGLATKKRPINNMLRRSPALLPSIRETKPPAAWHVPAV